MTPYEIIELLRATPGLNDKRSILRTNKDNKLLQRVLTMTLDPRITFGIKKIPKYDFVSHSLTLTEAMDALGKLITRDATGNNGIELLKNILESVTEKDAQVIKWIIAKDFKAGFGESIINDEMKPFSIYSVPYMGAVSYSEKRIRKILENGNALSEVKMDGRYLNCVVRNNSVFMESRGGKPNPLMGCLEKEALALSKEIGYDEVVFNGELMLKGEKDRYKANGIISSFVSIAQKEFDGVDITKEIIKFEKVNEMSIDEVKERIQLVVWDFIPYSDYLEKIWEVPRTMRLKILETAIENTDSFQLVEYKVIHTYSEAIEHFQEMLARGEEGTIVKSFSGIWEDKKPTYQCKMKVEISTDLIIVEFNYGTPGTKNENVISSLNVESTCGELKTSPGGITENDMSYITENMDMLLGKIVEVKSCGISKDSKDNYSLLHPVFEKLRLDKNTGDDLQNIIEIDSMAKGLKKMVN